MIRGTILSYDSKSKSGTVQLSKLEAEFDIEDSILVQYSFVSEKEVAEKVECGQEILFTVEDITSNDIQVSKFKLLNYEC